MSVFLIPLNLCAELERMMNSFWWGNKEDNKHGIHWMAWDKLSVNKAAGGMSFRKFHEFNVAMLGKQGWRLLIDSSSLVARVYKARYYPLGSFLDAQLGNNLSYIWRSVLASQKVIRDGVRWRVGVGNHINVWSDPWLPDQRNPYVESLPSAGLEHATVDTLKNIDGRGWD